MTSRQRVAVVTGGGSGIGAAIAEELGRGGWFVVTLDPMVTLDGSETLPAAQETTAGRIVAGGGSARTSSVSVADGDAVRGLFAELAGEHGAVDAVVNVAGITRQTGFAHGTEEDWLAVLSVHLGGYLNILNAALPLMAETGRGHVLGVTSGSGWRPADAGAYSCAKRAVAALTWQLGRQAPSGVTVNAMSPIAATRMVAAAIERAREAARSGARAGSGGGLSLNSMPGPEALGPFGAYLVSDAFAWCSGRVLFAGGSEVAVIDEPRLIEVVRTDGAAPLERVLHEVVPRAFVSAEKHQASDGGGNPRFGAIFDELESPETPGPDGEAPPAVRTCLVVSDRPEWSESLVVSLESRSIRCHQVDVGSGFGEAAARLRSAHDAAGPIDAVVVAPAIGTGTGTVSTVGPSSGGWERVLAEHQGIVEDIHVDAAWARAAADYAATDNRPVRLLTLTDATTAGGRSRAQASAQLARAAASTTDGRVTALAVSVEAAGQHRGTTELAAHLLTGSGAPALAGAELVVGDGWIGLRRHPRPLGSIVFGGPEVPRWLDGALREIVGGEPGGSA